MNQPVAARLMMDADITQSNSPTAPTSKEKLMLSSEEEVSRPPYNGAKRSIARHLMSKKKRAFAFVEDWRIFPDQTLVIVGKVNKEQAIKLAKKIRATKDFIDDLTACNHPFDKPSFARMGKSNSSILYLPEYKDEWVFWETLIHELHHAVTMTLAEGRDMQVELEALAYAQENLFRNIRRKLQGVEPFKKVTL